MSGANWAPAALLLLLAAAAAADEPLEDEVESAPFAIVVEHEDGWRCGGALVSLRAALSTATCARGRGAPPVDLWARAPGAITAEGARRVARVALATDSQGSSENEKWTEEAWIGVVLDMALLELEAPFGAAAGARPILMAAGEECEPRGTAPVCHVVRTPARAGGPLRVGNAERTSPMVCATVAPHWAAISDTALCLVGPEFCQSDWGVGVVCAGKLCGVLSRSARSPGESGENSSEGGGGGGGNPGCGDTHAALHVPRWQQFVHCAQTRRRCGRDSCASVCSERMLLEAPVKEPRRGGDEGGLARRDGKHRPRHRTTTSTTEVSDDYTKMRVTTYSTPRSRSVPESEWPTIQYTWRRADADVRASAVPTRTSTSPPSPPLPSPSVHLNASTMGSRMAQFEFEPYRADFKIGEYSDNEASYDAGGGEEPTRTSSSSSEAPTSRVPEALQEDDPPDDANATAQLVELDSGVARQFSATTFQICLRHFYVILILARIFINDY
ncbi:uncharacterized protein LOC133524693 [Cydia pomonella]|uniref:uncharacterized protein LOC133524693 n=1 Tax=Cydia pomonella TaxID=82600 RepID=UPI002ADDC3C1|nr:uncharacterized protein LOC133524693 [Cydia pomonella]